MEFDKLNWHDAIINNIEIDRRNPGLNDIILFEIIWPNGKVSKLSFEDVYLIKLTLNCGIRAPESVYTAFIAEQNDVDLLNFYDKWNGLMNDVQLTCYVINTASTGGEIKILAKTCREIT